MKWASAISRDPNFEKALSECILSVRQYLGEGEVSLVIAFVTPHHAVHYGEMPAVVSGELAPNTFLGCTGGGVIGGPKGRAREVERFPALSLVAARLPGAEVSPLRVSGPLPDPDASPESWEGVVGSPANVSGFLLLADPFSFRVEPFLAGLDYAYPGLPKVGGLASGGTSPNTNALFLDGQTFTDGLVGVALGGDLALDTVVAQGCRPVGDLMLITACDGNFLYELDGRPAFEVVRDLFDSLGDRDRDLARSSLFAGILMDEFAPDPAAGDFLIRNILGLVPAQRALAVGERLEEGMRLRFHVRDARTSAEDLRNLLRTYATSPAEARGAVLFSCLGRGEGLYGVPGFDTDLLRREVGAVPVGGFFCNGEIGPVKGSTFLHGYTSSFAFFRPASESP